MWKSHITSKNVVDKLMYVKYINICVFYTKVTLSYLSHDPDTSSVGTPSSWNRRLAEWPHANILQQPI